MSSYVSFYLRKKDTDEYTPLYSVSRSHPIYSAFQDTLGNNMDQYGRCSSIKKSDISDMIKAVASEIKDYKGVIADCEQELKEIPNWNNSIDEKYEVLQEVRSRIKGCKEEIDYLEFASSALAMLINIIDEQDFKDEGQILYGGIDARRPNAEAKKLGLWESEEE